MKKTSKKLIAMLVCLVLVIGAMAVSALAADVVASGKCGENVKWVLTDDGKLTISGQGDMYDTGIRSAPWYDYRETITSAVIQEGITEIGTEAFYGCINMESISLPESLTSIGWDAFKSCSSLTSVDLPAGITSLESYTFAYCSSLESVTLPEVP